uniref:Neur_chan_LBD domain-containing protein n=1 Tax=Strongyloides venezuelensis TaxID=75913 RepID=A0A0K0FHU9_STRVS
MLCHFNIIITTIIFLYLPLVSSLTAEERSELQRKMKYYHSSVRPSEKFNMISSINGTFFDIPTEIRVMDIYIEDEKLYIDCTLILNYYDERLQIRELKQNMKIPQEFQLWSPAIYIDRRFLNDYNSFLDPVNGYVSLIYKIKYTKNHCIYLTWKHPFQTLTCSIAIETENDEHLSLKIDRDMRSSIKDFSYITNEWPILKIEVTIKSYWQSTIATIYLPSILLFSLGLFAQFKRRKVQVQILTSAIICIVFLHSTKYISSSFRSVLTMQDVWLLGTFIHLVSLLSLDLLLPSKHILYDVDKENDKVITQTSLEVSKRNSINHNGRRCNVKFHDQVRERNGEECRDMKSVHFEKSILRNSNSTIRESQRSSYDNINKDETKFDNSSCYHNFSYEGSPSILKNKFHLEAYPLILANNSLTTHQGKRGNASINSPQQISSGIKRQMLTDIKGQTSLIEIDDINKRIGKKKIINNVNEPNNTLLSTVKFRRHPPTTSPKFFSIIYTLSEKKKFGVFIVLCAYIIFVFIYTTIVIGIL